MSIGDRIRWARERKGLTQDEVALKFNISRNAVSLWESGDTAPRGQRLAILAGILDINVEWLITGEGNPDSTPTPNEVPAGAVLVAKGFVQAGCWKNSNELPADEWISVSSHNAYSQYPHVTALLIQGDSMDKWFPQGTIIIVAPVLDYGVPESGDFVVVWRRCTDGFYEWTVKEYRIDAAGAWLVPHSSNLHYQPQLLPKGDGESGPLIIEDGRQIEEIQIWGVVVGRHDPNKPKVRLS